MSKNGASNVMACGACAVYMDENGQMRTSIDLLANGIRQLFSGRARTGTRPT